MSECFNSWILTARHKTIITMMLEEMRVKMMTRIGYEVKGGLCQHTVDLARRNCSYRAWQLNRIPCVHALAAIHHKQYEPLDYIHSCYNKETYLRTYAIVLQPVTNMKMWPIFTHPTVAPPEITSMPGQQR